MLEKTFIATNTLREALDKGYDLKFTFKGIPVIVRSKLSIKDNSYHSLKSSPYPVYVGCEEIKEGVVFFPSYDIPFALPGWQQWFGRRTFIGEKELEDWQWLIQETPGKPQDLLWKYYDYPMKPELVKDWFSPLCESKCLTDSFYNHMLIQYGFQKETNDLMLSERSFVFKNPIEKELMLVACTKEKPKRPRPHKHRRSSWNHHPIATTIGRSAIKKVLVPKHDTSIAIRKELRFTEKAAKVPPVPMSPSERYSIKSPFRIVRRGSKPKGVRRDPYLRLQIIDATPHKYELRSTVSKKSSRKVRINLLEEEKCSFNSIVPVYTYIPRLFRSKKHPEWNEIEPTINTHWIPVLDVTLKELVEFTKLKRPQIKAIRTAQYPQNVIQLRKDTKTVANKLPVDGHALVFKPKRTYVETSNGVLCKETSVLYKKENFYMIDKTQTT